MLLSVDTIDGSLEPVQSPTPSWLSRYRLPDVLAEKPESRLLCNHHRWRGYAPSCNLPLHRSLHFRLPGIGMLDLLWLGGLQLRDGLLSEAKAGAEALAGTDALVAAFARIATGSVLAGMLVSKTTRSGHFLSV
jgi:hypothetical protein